MESDDYEASADYDQQFGKGASGDTHEMPSVPAEAMAPPVAVGSNAKTAALTDAELDAYLADEEPAMAASGAGAAHADPAVQDSGRYTPPSTSKSISAAEKARSEAPQGYDSIHSTLYKQSNSMHSNSSDNRAAEVAPAAAVAQVHGTANEGYAMHGATGSEEEYAIEFNDEPSRNSLNPTGHSLAQHAQEPAATATAAEPALQDSILSAQSSRTSQAHPAASPAAAGSCVSSGHASRRSSTSNHAMQVGRTPSGTVKARTMQQEQSWTHMEHEPAVYPAVHAAAGCGSGWQANRVTPDAALLEPGVHGIQQLFNSPVRPIKELEPAAAAQPAACSSCATVSRSSTGGRRPGSAGLYRQDSGRQQQPRHAGSWQQSLAQQACQQQEIEVLPVAKWEVRDVCDWVDGLGLSQYRKKLMHHCVNGRLLTKLTDELLKTEVGIGPLGHRFMLLEAIESIRSADLAAAAAGIWPTDCSATAATAIQAAAAVAAAAVHRPSSRHSSGAGGRSHAGGVTEVPSGNGSAAAQVYEDVDNARSRGSRPSSAPCRGSGRSPSPQASSPGALGPAAGRISVYEQRAKILFELGRAEARAATQSSTAAQVGDVARLAAEEVARLKGQLADLDRKNRLQVAHSSGSVDNRGQIPWQHVGAGTRAAHPHPDSLAKPWDPPDADLTFQPKISKKSQQIMAESRGESGGAGFLDRLGDDLRRRETKIKELELRHHGSAGNPADAAAITKAAAVADLSLLAGFLTQRGWANIPTGRGSSSGNDMGTQQELDEQLDEVVESYRKELNLGDAQAQAILAARGSKKVSALAAAVRTCQFMDRYKADLSTRDSRLNDLQEKWFKQQFGTGVPRPGSAAPMTQEQRDMASAVAWFKALGWEDTAEEEDCDDLLAALIKRACAYKAEVQKLHDKALAAAAAGQQAAPSQKPVIDWQSPPWSSDGLNSRVQKVLDARKASADTAADHAAVANRPSPVDSALQAAGKLQSSGSSTTPASNSTNTNNSDPLEHAVQLLAGMRSASLEQLEAVSGKAKKLAVYRALRTQSFLEFTAADLAARDAKQRAQWEAIEASRRGKQVSKQELDDFYRRLQEDGERRKVELAKAKADKIDRETKALALLKASTAASSARSARVRPKSAAASVGR